MKYQTSHVALMADLPGQPDAQRSSVDGGEGQRASASWFRRENTGNLVSETRSSHLEIPASLQCGTPRGSGHPALLSGNLQLNRKPQRVPADQLDTHLPYRH